VDELEAILKQAGIKYDEKYLLWSLIRVFKSPRLVWHPYRVRNVPASDRWSTLRCDHRLLSDSLPGWRL